MSSTCRPARCSLATNCRVQRSRPWSSACGVSRRRFFIVRFYSRASALAYAFITNRWHGRTSSPSLRCRPPTGGSANTRGAQRPRSPATAQERRTRAQRASPRPTRRCRTFPAHRETSVWDRRSPRHRFRLDRACSRVLLTCRDGDHLVDPVVVGVVLEHAAPPSRHDRQPLLGMAQVVLNLAEPARLVPSQYDLFVRFEVATNASNV